MTLWSLTKTTLHPNRGKVDKRAKMIVARKKQYAQNGWPSPRKSQYDNLKRHAESQKIIMTSQTVARHISKEQFVNSRRARTKSCKRDKV